jgi:tripartite-type tricarboxylate transporter receptor subunit TctC
LIAGVCSNASAQAKFDLNTWPSKPIKLLVGFPAGTSPDLAARTLAEPLSKALGQPVVVENKPGAGGNIAADLVAKSNDLHTFGVMINGNLTIAKLLNPQTPFDPAKDLAPISLIGTAPLVLAAPSSANLPEDPAAFLGAARQAGNSWSYGSPGVGTVGHLGMELLKLNAGVFIVHVPYRGAAPAVSDLLGGAVQAAMPNLSVVLPMIKAGRLRAIAYATKERSKLIPDVATFAESGMPGYESTTWYSLAAPAGTPPEVLQRLRQAVHALLDSPEYQALMLAQGSEVMKLSAAETLEFVRRDFRQTDALIKSAKIKIEN